MDKDRQIRFLYPPLIFLSSLALGTWIDYPNGLSIKLSDLITNANTTSLVVAILGVGSLVLVLGYLIGTITILILRLLFARNGFNYEFKLPDQIYRKIGKLIFKTGDDLVGKKERMYAAVVFDHSYINERIHGWIVRRWNAFLIASFSVVGLLSSLICGPLLGISITWSWFLTVAFFIFCFIVQGRLSWIETMKMVAFLTKVKRTNEDASNDSGKNVS